MIKKKSTKKIEGLPGYFRKATGIIYGTRIIDGKRRRISTRTTDPAKAVSNLNKLNPKLNRQSDKKKGRKDFPSAWDSWADLKAKYWRPNTTIDIKYKGIHLKEFFDSFMIDEITEELWEEYIEENASKRKLAKERDYLSMCLNFYHSKGEAKRIPKLRNPDKKSEVGKAYTDTEMDRIFIQMEADSLNRNYHAPDLKLQVLMQFKMGMRSGEVLKLKKSRIDFTTESINLVPADTKTKKARTIPIAIEVLPLLQAKVNSSDSEFVFPSPKDPTKPLGRGGNVTAWKNVLRRVGIEGRRHDLRHTCATNMGRREVDPLLASKVLGMSLTMYTEKYMHLPTEDLRRVFAK